ncbi:hypothetical protein GCM10018954_031560 [Kutzneria kofuensis]
MLLGHLGAGRQQDVHHTRADMTQARAEMGHQPLAVEAGPDAFLLTHCAHSFGWSADAVPVRKVPDEGWSEGERCRS